MSIISVEKHIVIVSSPPNGGKGGVASDLVENCAFRPVPMGDLIRAEAAAGRLPEKVIEMCKRGYLAPNNIVEPLANQAFTTALDFDSSIVFDGVLRTEGQVRSIIARLLAVSKPRGFYRLSQIHLRTPFDECERRRVGRWETEHRADDDPEVFKNRLVVYSRCTVPAIELIEELGVETFHIDVGYNRPKAEVREQVRKCLNLPSLQGLTTTV